MFDFEGPEKGTQFLMWGFKEAAVSFGQQDPQAQVLLRLFFKILPSASQVGAHRVFPRPNGVGLRAGAVKVGMLSSEICMKTVAEKLRQYKPKYTVIDPVMVAKGGHALMKPEALEALKTEVIPLAYVLTPNIPEAETITEMMLLV